MPPHGVAALVHLVGFVAGAALYAMLFALVVRRRVREDRLPLLTAILGLLWNLAGLAAYGIRDLAGREPDPMLVATAYSALGFLPAVVVHSVLRSQTAGPTRRAARLFIWAAYLTSTIAETLMFWSARHGAAPSAGALQLLTWSYVALTIPVLFLTRRRGDAARGWSIVALALFAVSALHLSRSESGHESWLIELVGHHASIPLIFAILYQDFRFALADLFLKRALSLCALVAIAGGLYAGVEMPLLARHDFRNDPVAIAVSIILWVALALVYPRLRDVATRVVDRLVLHRADYARLRDRLAHELESAQEPEAVLDQVAAALREPLSAPEVHWSDDAPDGVLVPTTEQPRWSLVIGRLGGGRRLMSDEHAMLHDVAALAARRIDAIRLARERSLTSEAELRALRAQVNPHFLFNALNTIGFLIQTSPQRAHATLMKLTALLRGVLRSGGAAVTLGEELALVTAYLEIEQARFDERLQVGIDVPEPLRGMSVPPLVIQPLVENAIKHGVAPSRAGGRIDVRARINRDTLVVTVRNTGVATTEVEIADGRRRGVGLTNLQARLTHFYGDAARVTLAVTPAATEAVVTLPATASVLARGA
jgi:two-component system, LytTR family, sensor kinase